MCLRELIWIQYLNFPTKHFYASKAFNLITNIWFLKNIIELAAVSFLPVSWSESSEFRYSRMRILNSRRYERLNKIIFNKIAKIAIKASYKVSQKQHSQSKKRSENLWGFITEALKLMTSEKKAAKIRNNSERGLISIWRVVGPGATIITFVEADTGFSIDTKSVLEGVIEAY